VTTGTDIVQDALWKSGVLGEGMNASNEMLNGAFEDLNNMLAQWRVKRWLVYRLLDLSVVSTGAVSYTIGPAGNIAVDARPDKLEAAYLRQLINGGLPVDTKLTLVTDRETYSSIAVKTLGSFPKLVFYDPAFPLGLIFPWPVPAAAIYEVHVIVKALLPQLAALAEEVTLPLEYYAAIKYNLARRQRVAYRLPKDEDLNGLAREALDVIRAANSAVPALRMPRRVMGRGKYNILSDQQH
jgi:hypothetical protein